MALPVVKHLCTVQVYVGSYHRYSTSSTCELHYYYYVVVFVQMRRYETLVLLPSVVLTLVLLQLKGSTSTFSCRAVTAAEYIEDACMDELLY